MQINSIKKLTPSLLVGLFVLHAGLGLYIICKRTVPKYDEAVYFNVSKGILSSGLPKLGTVGDPITFRHPPFARYINAVIIGVSGSHGFTVARVFSLICSVLTLGLLWKIVRKLSSEPIALLTIGFAALSPLNILHAGSLYTEPVLNVLLIGMWFAWFNNHLFWAGLLAGTACITKYSAIPFVVLALFFSYNPELNEIRLNLKKVRFCSALLILPLLWLGFALLTDPETLFHDIVGLTDLFHAKDGGLATYASRSFFLFKELFPELGSPIFFTFLISPLLVLFHFRKGLRQTFPTSFFPWLISALFFVLVICLSYRRPRYLLPALPWAAFAFSVISYNLFRKYRGQYFILFILLFLGSPLIEEIIPLSKKIIGHPRNYLGAFHEELISDEKTSSLKKAGLFLDQHVSDPGVIAVTNEGAILRFYSGLLYIPIDPIKPTPIPSDASWFAEIACTDDQRLSETSLKKYVLNAGFHKIEEYPGCPTVTLYYRKGLSYLRAKS